MFVLTLREWALSSKVKLLGSCGGPAHFSGERLEAIHPRDLRCQSQEAMLKAEFEEANRARPLPTEEPENKVKCPASCVCEVSGIHRTLFYSVDVWIRARRDCPNPTGPRLLA